MVERDSALSVRRQCGLLSIDRSGVYRHPRVENKMNEAIMLEIDKIMLEAPASGSRTIADALSLRFGVAINRKRIIRLTRKMGVEAVYPKRKTTIPGDSAHIYPYLLRNLDIVRPNQAWCSDITYIPMRGGHMYLCAVMDWFSRKILAWRISNTMDASFCLDALNAAVAAAGTVPEIFNTDQGSQFTSKEWAKRLEELGVAISMDGKGRWVDNVLIERFWRSLKYDDLYLNLYETVPELEKGVAGYIERYNSWKPHSALGKRVTPDMAYSGEYSPLSRVESAGGLLRPPLHSGLATPWRPFGDGLPFAEGGGAGIGLDTRERGVYGRSLTGTEGVY